MQTREATIKLKDLESQAVDDTFVILSDIWLDKEEVLRKLGTVLDGFESVDIVPSLFVFMGNFCSSPCNLSFSSYSSLRQQFGKLGRMIGNHPRIKAIFAESSSTTRRFCSSDKIFCTGCAVHV